MAKPPRSEPQASGVPDGPLLAGRPPAEAVAKPPRSEPELLRSSAQASGVPDGRPSSTGAPALAGPPPAEAQALLDPGLAARGVRHGFGVRGLAAPRGILRPRQVHGATALRAEACRGPGPAPEADAIVTTEPGAIVGVVTADCVPILLVAGSGAGVAAVHAGWRGLAAGVVAAGVRELARASGAGPARIAAAIGPHIGACCYEVDAPVLDALVARLGAEALASAAPVRAGHWLLDLGALATHALVRAGVPGQTIGKAAARCTACDAENFHSHRRDGAGAGRLVHFVEVPRVSGEDAEEA